VVRSVLSVRPTVKAVPVDTTPPPPSERSFGAYVDLLVRAAATLLVAIYGLGFVILGVYEARYGIFQFSPLRARIFLVGFTFIALIALPVAAHHYKLAYYGPLAPVFNNADPKLQNYRNVVLAGGFIFTAFFMAGMFNLLLIPAASTKSYRWWHTAVFAAGFLALLEIYAVVGKRFSERPKSAAAAALLTTGAFMACLSFAGEHLLNLTCWFFLCGVAAQLVRCSTDRLRLALDFRNWFFVIVEVWFYAVAIFGIMPAKIGGGAPTSMVLYLNGPVAWLDRTPASVSLLDETDQGFYVLTPGKSRALFIPRSDVGSVYFGPAEDAMKSK
jgi:hypothetical protein